MDSTFYPIIIFVAIGVVLIIVALNNLKKQNLPVKRYRAIIGFHSTGHTYVPGQFSGQMELDMRLPYRRFKQLYPESRWTYEEYKKMQMKSAFRRSTSSQENKRMVR